MAQRRVSLLVIRLLQGMKPDMGGDVTALLRRWNDGDSDAGEEVMSLLYTEVRRIAGNEFKRERPEHTLQPTALAHEAYMRLVKGQGMQANDRAHFLAITARVIRQVLVDYSRERGRQKRGGDQQRVEVEVAEELLQDADLDFVDLHSAMTRLEAINARAAAVVELKFIGGLTIDEIAGYLDASPATISREWTFARAWLRRELQPDS